MSKLKNVVLLQEERNYSQFMQSNICILCDTHSIKKKDFKKHFIKTHATQQSMPDNKRTRKILKAVKGYE